MTERKFGIITRDEMLLEYGSEEYKQGIERKKDWQSYFPPVEWLEDQFDYLVEQNGSDWFVPYECQGWYFEAMLNARRMLESAVKNGNTVQAIIQAGELGQLMAESRIKFEWEETALWGASRLAESRDAATARRKRSAEDRYNDVEALKKRGKSQNNAFRIVARNEGSHPKTIEADYYKHKKTRTE